MSRYIRLWTNPCRGTSFGLLLMHKPASGFRWGETVVGRSCQKLLMRLLLDLYCFCLFAVISCEMSVTPLDLIISGLYLFAALSVRNDKKKIKKYEKENNVVS